MDRTVSPYYRQLAAASVNSKKHPGKAIIAGEYIFQSTKRHTYMFVNIPVGIIIYIYIYVLLLL